MRTLPPLLATGPGALVARGPSDEVFLLGNAREGVLVKAITPVLGGGVESFAPDTVDVVRVPTIRGAVRWWWRALQPTLPTDTLRQRGARMVAELRRMVEALTLTTTRFARRQEAVAPSSPSPSARTTRAMR